MEDVTATLTWSGLWRDRGHNSTTGSLNQPDGTSESPAVKQDKKVLV